MRRIATVWLLGALFMTSAQAPLMMVPPAPLPTVQDPRLQLAYTFGRIPNAVTTTVDGRIFVGFPQTEGPEVQVQEILPGSGEARPYPDAAWNRGPAAAGGDLLHSFVLINALRIGPDGALWLMDAGSPGIGKPAVLGGARLFRVDLATNKVSRVYDLSSASRTMSYIDDIRFNGGQAYLTDAGDPALLVLDLATGQVRRVLDHDPSTTDTKTMRADGKELFDDKGQPKRVHADQLEVSPDGRWLYYLPASGPIYRIETRWLDNAALPATQLAAHVEPWLDTPTTGGTAIDATGTIYYGDADARRILLIRPDRSVSTLIADPRLIWIDAMWIDTKGTLWIPANQQNLSPGFNGGKSEVNYPVAIYTMKVDAQPSPIDHGGAH